MPTIDESPCPNCGEGPGTLSISVGSGLQVLPTGSFSLAGAQMKFSARATPMLCCSACGLRRDGRWDDDGQHMTFGPVPMS
jgi:hypothetical protein